MNDDTLWTEAHERHKDRFEYTLLHEEDDLGAVVRAQVFVEYYLRRCIEAACRDKMQVSTGTWNRLQFESRLELALALGLELTGEHVSAFKHLAWLRNQLSHRIGTELEEGHANDLLGRLPPRLREDVGKLRQPNDDWNMDFRTALYVLVLELRIQTAEHKARWDHAKAQLEGSWELKPLDPADIAKQVLELTDMAGDTDGATGA